ncbi:MAG: DUF1905 domain-containing protein [Xanthomonadales bacterium]|nr:DUF1905 domain-containing protein [Xanthomonadales bacterium]
MAASSATIHFTAPLQRPAEPKGAAWLFVVLPGPASAKLPTRSMTTVDGTLGGQAFQVTLEPDGAGSHWFKIGHALARAAGAKAGDTVGFSVAPVAVEPEPKVPPDLRKALAGHAAAKAQWATLTAVARRDWIHWISSGKKAETRVKRIATTCDKLACGQRRACCFDRSGMFSRGNIGAPKAAS